MEQGDRMNDRGPVAGRRGAPVMTAPALVPQRALQ